MVVMIRAPKRSRAQRTQKQEAPGAQREALRNLLPAALSRAPRGPATPSA